MPTFVLGDWQVQTVLTMAGVDDLAPHSPLRVHRRYPRPIAPGEPDWQPLVDWGVVKADGQGWRVNSVIAGILRACAEPDEVIHVGVGNLANPGFTVVRRGGVVSECTITSGGTTKLCFPISRSAVLLSLVSALSGDDAPRVEPSGFRFRGPAQDAFVLGTALREARADYAPLTMSALREAVMRDARNDALVFGFALTAGYEPLRALATDPSAVDAAIRRLAGTHLTVTGTAVGPSAASRTALLQWPHAVFGVSHLEVVGGRPVSRAMQAMRCGNRFVVFRACGAPDRPPEFEWAEVTLDQLRALTAAFVLTDEQLAAVGATPRPVARTRTTRLSATTAALPWAPTHVVPASGLAAYEKPDPASSPVANLGARLPVQVTETLGAWSHVVCSNGWSAWVDGRYLEPGADTPVG